MTKTLHLAPGLSLPIDAVTQAIGILAKRRAGKSYTARRFAEQLFKAGQQIVIVDPKGDWWGIRSSADGNSPGLPVVILGGERGDVPLEVSAGEVVAKLVTEERVSVLLDLSLFRKHEVATFMTAFLETLYRLKAREIYRTPLMLLIDEADAIAPQKPQENEARMLGAAEDIVRRGGQRGLGSTLITQRSAVLNKNVLTQVEMIVALRTIAPQDLKALDAWVEVHGEKDQRDTLMASLPALPVGDAWFWSPGWPTTDGIFQRVHVSPIETFDSGASPKAGEKRVEPRNLADVDLASLTRQMAATIEKAKENDPKELKRKISELNGRIRQLEKSPATTRVVEKPVVDQLGLLKAEAKGRAYVLRKLKPLRAAVVRSYGSVGDLNGTLGALVRSFDEIEKEPIGAVIENAKPGALLASKEHRLNPSSPVASLSGSTPERRSDGHARRDSRERPASNSSIGKGERTVLRAIAQYPEGAERDQLTVLTGYKRSTRDTYIQRLSLAGHVAIEGGRVFATDTGVDVLGSDFEALPQGEELQSYWLDRLPEGERAILEPLLQQYPAAVDRDALSEATGYKRSTRDTYLQRLGSRRLVENVGRGEVRASDNLFS